MDWPSQPDFCSRFSILKSNIFDSILEILDNIETETGNVKVYEFMLAKLWFQFPVGNEGKRNKVSELLQNMKEN